MKKIIIVLFSSLLLFSACDFGGLFDNDTEKPTAAENLDQYYSDASGLTGDALKESLHKIIHGHDVLSYAKVYEALKYTDIDPENSDNVILLYKQISYTNEHHNSSDVCVWNREHVWAKAHGQFSDSKGAGTDLHHIRPTDVSVNNNRGNKDFDNGGNPHSEAVLCKTDSDSWEPGDDVKGDVARMMFYMAVRYEGCQADIDDDDITVKVDLELVDYITGSTKEPIFGKLSILKEWHKNDPVSEFEKRRNDLIYSDYQHNRNPFIDHPEFVELIW